MSSEVSKTFEVSMMSASESVEVFGLTLGDLRKAVQLQFAIPAFEQKIIYSITGDAVVLDGDDSVPMKDKGLLDVTDLTLARMVDPRFQMEKETAFLEALAACRFSEAKDILQSSGVSIDPNCIRKGRPQVNVPVSESPYSYMHPALTVAVQSGLEHAIGRDAGKLQAWMSREQEVCEIVQLLIDMRADVNATGDELQDCESAGMVVVHSKTPLCAAVQRGSPILVRVLLDAKADPNHTMRYDQSAWGPDRNNPLGPGVLNPASWLRNICNGSVGTRSANDPRVQYSDEIRDLLSGQDTSELRRQLAEAAHPEYLDI